MEYSIKQRMFLVKFDFVFSKVKNIQARLILFVRQEFSFANCILHFSETEKRCHLEPFVKSYLRKFEMDTTLNYQNAAWSNFQISLG